MKRCFRPAVTLMELVIAMAMIGIIFAAILPQFALIRNSWDVKQGTAEALQNGRVLMEHINRNLSKAVRITAVSASSDTDGYIEFEDNDSNTLRYDIAANNYVEYGVVGNLADLAGPVSLLRFTCYDACDLDTALSPVADTNDVRVVKVNATFTNSGSLGQDKTFTTWVYLRVNAQSRVCWENQDIGAVAATGSATFADCNWTVVGSGVDIWDNTDEFHYVYQSLNGDGQIVARVVSMTNTDPWAKAGVMIRETLTGGSKHAIMVVTPGNGTSFQRRTSTGGGSTNTDHTGVAAPYWVKLIRRGNTFTGYDSLDGGKTWNTVGSDTVTMSSSVYIGLAVTSHNDGVLCTANFDNVSFLTYDAFTEAKVSTDDTSITIPTPGSAGTVSILGSWVEGTTHTKESGTNRALVFIAHAEDNDDPSIVLNSVSYGGQSMTKVIESVVGTTSNTRAYVVAFILNEARVTAASGDTFVVSWNQTPDSAGYSSVFLQNINQTTLIGGSAGNGVTNTGTITTAALATNNGDIVLEAATSSSTGTYTPNNSFTEALEVTIASADGCGGYKLATGAAETPSVTHSDSTNVRHVLIGFVVRCRGEIEGIEDDLLIAAVATDGDTSGSIAAPVGQGWTLINRGAYNGEVTLSAWWKNAGASEPGSHTFTWTGGSQQAYGWMMRFAGHDPSNPINALQTNGQTSITPTSPAVPTTVDGCLILRLGAFDDGYITPDAPGLSGHSPITMDSSGGTVAILGSWTTGTTHAKEPGTNRALVFVAHAEGNTSGSTPSLTSVTYGGQAMTKVVERVNSSGTTRTYTVAFILNEAGINAATTTTFTPNWSTAPTNVAYSSVFLQNVNQTTLTGATASNQTSTGATITTAALSTSNGDMVIEAGTCSNTGTYTANNGFTALEVTVTNADGMDGYKAATGTSETPSVTHSRTTERQTLIGFVVQGTGRVSGGAGYVRQATAGNSGTSTFSLTVSNEAQMLTIAIAPDSSKGEVCCGGGLRP